MLHALFFAPFAAGLLTAFLAARDGAQALRWVAVASIPTLVLAFLAFGLGRPAETEAITWFAIAGADVNYQLRVGGLSAWLVHLVNVLVPLALLGGVRIAGSRMREFACAVFLLQGCMNGALLAADLVMFYLFFEAMLLPMVVMVVLLGDRDRRAAAMQFFLYTMAGSIFFLVAIWYLLSATGTADIAVLADRVGDLPERARELCFLAFCVAFAVKVPLVPLNSWQPLVYASAPAPATALLSGAMAKIGIYGFVALTFPLFPSLAAEYAHVFQILALIGVIGGSAMALVEYDLKRLVAFASLAHLNLVVLGIFTFHEDAMVGAIVQMVAHGLAVAALFLLLGHLEFRRGRRFIDDFGGICDSVPGMTSLFVVATLCAIAVPGTAAFVGEFMILLGVARAENGGLWYACLGGLGMILGAAYMLRVVRQVFFGERRERLDPMTPSEAFAVAPLVAACLVLGFYPLPVIDAVRDDARVLVDELRRAGGGEVSLAEADAAREGRE